MLLRRIADCDLLFAESTKQTTSETATMPRAMYISTLNLDSSWSGIEGLRSEPCCIESTPSCGGEQQLFAIHLRDVYRGNCIISLVNHCLIDRATLELILQTLAAIFTMNLATHTHPHLTFHPIHSNTTTTYVSPNTTILISSSHYQVPVSMPNRNPEWVALPVGQGGSTTLLWSTVEGEKRCS